MIHYKTPDQIELMRKSALIVSETLGIIAEKIEPGVTTLELDKIAYEFINDKGGKPAFLGLYGFPNTLCMSVNEQVVHGIPNNTPLQEGDILSVDCGVLLNGWYGDHAYTFAVGEIDDAKKRLLRVTYESLEMGIQEMKSLNRVGDISNTIQTHCERNGYGVVRELVGHGLGKKLHEAPQVPNYGRRHRGDLLKSGIVLAIEPMINMGTYEVVTLSDKWTVVTKDRLPSAHFEHDVAIVSGKPELLSTFKYVEESLAKKGSFCPSKVGLDLKAKIIYE